VAQIVTVGATLLYEVRPWDWVGAVKQYGLWTVFGLTIFSALHYVFLLVLRLNALTEKTARAT
jgi:hypothetical protein